MRDGMLTREEILRCIEAEGAIHKSELCRIVGHGWGTISHHLHVLEREGRVEMESHGKHTWAFPSRLSPGQRQLLMVINTPGRWALLHLLEDRRATVAELSEGMEASKKVVRAHLSQLLSAGLVERELEDPDKYWLRRRRKA